MTLEYTTTELMAVSAARYLVDGSTVVVGTGVPCAAAMLAQKTTAPGLMILFEAGGVGAMLPTMPISVGDSRTFWRGLFAGSMSDIMDACQRGMIDYAFLGGAQIDAYGNLNSTVIGDYDRPKTRLPGSGGANDLASLCWQTIIVMPQDKRRFVASVDFLTTPGYLTGAGAREAAGLPAGTGPYKVVTNLAILGFDERTCRMRVEGIHPGVSREDIIGSSGFNLLWADDVAATSVPTADELRILREEVDPYRYVIGRS